MIEYLLLSHSFAIAVAPSVQKCEEYFEFLREFLETDRHVYCLGCFHDLFLTFNFSTTAYLCCIAGGG
jgi:hypothetical protein